MHKYVYVYVFETRNPEMNDFERKKTYKEKLSIFYENIVKYKRIVDFPGSGF